MRKTIILPVVAMLAILTADSGWAGISMSVDRNMLDFRAGNPGEEIELADQGTYHNQVSLSSTNNKTWYFRAHLVRPLTSGTNTIPNENFKWEVVSIGAGSGIITNNINVPTPFTTTPSIIYTSGDADNSGTVINIQFRYHLAIPKNQIAGAYDAVIRLTMNELL
jgi:hypothetical protein